MPAPFTVRKWPPGARREAVRLTKRLLLSGA